MPDILEQILNTKRRELEESRLRQSLAELQRAVENAPPPRDFFSPLAAPGPVRLIAEIKRASPSRGLIRQDFDPAELARVYESHGATCLSVLTDGPFFQGSLEHLAAVRQAVELPLLRKDFIIDTFQLYEARAAGADAVLLIAECLDDCRLRKLHNEALELGMTPLVELYEPENMQRVLDAGATLIGINNRNLRTFETDLEHTLRLAERVPEHCVLVAESGIRTRDDVARLAAAGVSAMLVGESLLLQADVGQAVDELLGNTHA